MESVASFNGRYERPAGASLAANALCTQFGGRLRKVFDVPAQDASADCFDALLRQIQEKLG